MARTVEAQLTEGTAARDEAAARAEAASVRIDKIEGGEGVQGGLVARVIQNEG